MKVLITGGAGYIGSTTATALEAAGHVPVVLDSLVTGPRAFTRGRAFYEGEVGDRSLLRRVLTDHPDIEVVIHMAARIVVPESVADPLLYYRDNVGQSIVLVDELTRLGVDRVVFSSSASVYAAPADGFEVREGDPVAPGSPYARTKLVVESILADCAATSSLRSISLRYFNPIGADPAMRSGMYAAVPTHVLGQILLAATGRTPAFTITGTDLPTRDGTGLRDYLHVWDLALAHVAAVERFDDVLATTGGTSTLVNVGTGRGVTVRELLTAFEAVHGRPVPVRTGPPRPGDVVGAYANVDRAADLLGWRSRSTLEEAVETALRWMQHRDRVVADRA